MSGLPEPSFYVHLIVRLEQAADRHFRRRRRQSLQDAALFREAATEIARLAGTVQFGEAPRESDSDGSEVQAEPKRQTVAYLVERRGRPE